MKYFLVNLWREAVGSIPRGAIYEKKSEGRNKPFSGEKVRISTQEVLTGTTGGPKTTP